MYWLDIDSGRRFLFTENAIKVKGCVVASCAMQAATM
jgi:hypothetical protein